MERIIDQILILNLFLFSSDFDKIWLDGHKLQMNQFHLQPLDSNKQEKTQFYNA